MNTTKPTLKVAKVQWVQHAQAKQDGQAIAVKDLPLNKPQPYFYMGSKTITTSRGESKLHEFVVADENGGATDNEVSIWGCHVLDNQLEEIEPQTLIRLTRIEAPAGKRYYNFKTEIGTRN